MKRQPLITVLFSLLIILGIYLLTPAFPVMAQDTQMAIPAQKTETMSPAEVDSHIAGMSDENVRQAYAQKLKQENEAKTPSRPRILRQNPAAKRCGRPLRTNGIILPFFTCWQPVVSGRLRPLTMKMSPY